jgi:ferric-dicitrate binding protein FerR (iron transport regulator)
MNAQIREAAAQWLVEFRTDTPDAAARRQFASWLRTSPEHIHAYLELLAVWEDAHSYDPHRGLDVDALIALARADRAITDLWTDALPGDVGETVAPEMRQARVTIPRHNTVRRLLRPSTGIAALLSLVINYGLVWIAANSHDATYSTEIAEQRSVVLTDGSHVDLDGLSNVRVNFTSHERTIELLSGQALFHVTKDAKRPFIVRVDGTRLRAVGTEFDVNRTPLGTVLTVLEGRVAVLTSDAPPRNHSGPVDTGVKVDAGQQATILHNTITAPQAVDTAAVTGWMRRLLVYTATPLPVVAEEFGRFNYRRLVIASPELADFRVTGVFRPFDPESLSDLVLYLRRQPGIEVVEKGNQISAQVRPR